MTKKASLMSFAAGLVVGLTMAFLWPFGRATPKAAAQQGAKADAPRFQISAWAFPASKEGDAYHGAYIIDTQKGDLWIVDRRMKPEKLQKPE
jgi:hypothetical protein